MPMPPRNPPPVKPPPRNQVIPPPVNPPPPRNPVTPPPVNPPPRVMPPPPREPLENPPPARRCAIPATAARLQHIAIRKTSFIRQCLYGELTPELAQAQAG